MSNHAAMKQVSDVKAAVASADENNADRRVGGARAVRRRAAQPALAAHRHGKEARAEQSYLSPEQVAQRLGVGVDKVKELMSHGLRYSDLGYRTVRIKIDWLEEFLEARSHAASREERNERPLEVPHAGLRK